MVLLSAIEDFVLRTLARLPARMDRLEYMAGLRNGEEYEHWGMTRIHGPKASRQALSNAHTDATLEILRTPIRNLSEELEGSPPERAENWQASKDRLIPADLGGGSKTHVNSVLVALGYLLKLKKSKSSNPPGA